MSTFLVIENIENDNLRYKKRYSTPILLTNGLEHLCARGVAHLAASLQSIRHYGEDVLRDELRNEGDRRVDAVLEILLLF